MRDRRGVAGVAFVRLGLFAGGSVAALATAGLVTASAALAQNECGAAVNGAVTCTSAGNPYPGGITYAAPGSLALTTDADVVSHGTVSVTSGGAATVAANGSVATTSANTLGIDVSAPGDIALSTASVSTTGNGSIGIRAISSAGDTHVTVGSSITTGNDASAVIATGNNVVVTATGAISTQGTFVGSSSTNGISATAVAGTATVVTSGPVSVAGAYTSGISVYGSQGTVVTASGPITATGYEALGINVDAANGAATVKAGSVATTGYFANALQINADNGGVAVQADAVSATGDLASGIIASGTTGATVTVGTVSTAGNGNVYGAYAFTSSGNAGVTAGTVTGTGNGTAGIYAATLGGSATVVATSVSETGTGTYGINALSTGTTSITVGNATANNVAAVRALGAGAAAVTLNGAAKTNSGLAAVVGSLGTATLTVGTGGSITLASGGAALYSPVASTVNNAGTIGGTAAGPVIAALAPSALGYPGDAAAALTFNNSGRFTGLVGFTAANDTVNNSGTYTALYNQDFGAGTDSFVNNGTLAALPGTAAAGSVAFTSLESFANNGVVDLRNGHAGDMLSLSGSYAGSGAATLGVDVDFASRTADRLAVAGAITGTTAVAITPIGGAVALNSGIVFATGGAGSSAGAFTLASHNGGAGLYRYDIAYSAPTDSFALVTTPGNAVFRALKINEAANTLWQESADGWSAHMANLRDAQTPDGTRGAGRIWGSFTGSTVQRDDAAAFTSFGRTRTVPLSYRLDAFGGQIGADLGNFGPGGAIRLGVTGGYLNSRQSFAAGENIRFDAANAGAYLAFRSGALFANLLGKYDHYWASGTGGTGGYGIDFHGDGYGGQGELGFRLGSDRTYAEPVVRLAYVRTTLSSYHPLGTTIDFDDFDGLRGKAGARFGATIGHASGVRVLLYGEGEYVHEFKGRDGIAFTSGDTRLAYRNDRLGDYGEGKIGFTATSGGVTGFVEGFGEESHDYKGGGGRAGLRIGF